MTEHGKQPDTSESNDDAREPKPDPAGETARGKPYDREAKLKELLKQDGESSPWSDPFMGF